MKRFPVFLLLIFASLFAQAQNAPLRYVKAKVFLEGKSVGELAKLGVEADHGIYRKGAYVENVFSEEELQRIEAAGFHVEVEIQDMAEYYRTRKALAQKREYSCAQNTTNWETPQEYSAGSMNGYLTLSELYEVLDSMQVHYPELISARMPIDTFLTQEGRPVYYLRLSDHPDTDEDEPEILYTALHHAREPNSMSQMVFFIWYLLENYDSDPNIKWLVDNTEMYFIPCVNPDGYVYNETQFPSGGGLWRKNRWMHNDTVYGVDLNRNYSYNWGYDDDGSSPFYDSGTFRGTAPASEPEIKAVNFLCNQHDFKIALNYHTYGNLLIHPWGYNDQETPDHAGFTALGRSMIKENHFLLGTGGATVGYPVNGDSDDWMYGAKGIFSMTPEVGPEFWPPQSQIIDLNKSVLYQDITAARLLHNEVVAALLPHDFNLSGGTMQVQITHPGLKSGTSQVALHSLNPHIQITTPAYSVNMQQLDTLVKTFDYTVAGAGGGIEEVNLVLSVMNETGTHNDTVSLLWIKGDIVLSESGNDLQTWSGDWSTTTSDYYSAPLSVTDSPDGDYDANSETKILSPEIDLTDSFSTGAALSFYAKWEIERGYDFAQVFATTDNGATLQPLCGMWTVRGNVYQDEDQPVYDGVQNGWVKESINLQDFLGQKIRIGFRMVSDNFVENDGFYFDDLKVYSVLPVGTRKVLREDGVRLYPVIAEDIINIETGEPLAGKPEIIISNSLGQILKKSSLPSGQSNYPVAVENLPPGVYFVLLKTRDMGVVKKFVKQ